tara:strand:- start:539 stop:775 length:237 start_codon:yes stop_codon:yes gene_type:complete
MKQNLKKKSDKLKLKIRLSENQDLRFIFKLNNKNVLKGNFFTSKQVNLKDHEKWFKGVIKQKMFFICLLKKNWLYEIR